VQLVTPKKPATRGRLNIRGGGRDPPTLSARSHRGLGKRQKKSGDRPAAEAEYRQAIDILVRLTRDDPRNAPYRLELALAHLDAGYWMRQGPENWADQEAHCRQAMQVLDKLVEDFPDVPLYREQHRARAGRDRLELLTALTGGPAFDPLFRAGVIRIPARHPVFRWACLVAGCERPRKGSLEMCYVHRVQLVWSEIASQAPSAYFP